MIVCVTTRGVEARETGPKETPGEPWRPLHAYRCYLHGPDGIHALRPHGPGAQRRYRSPTARSTNAARVERPPTVGASGTVRVECSRDVFDMRSPVLRPGNRDEIESKRAADLGIRAHPGCRCPADVSPLGPGDGFRGGLRTWSTRLDLDEYDLTAAGSYQVDFVPARTPVSREDPITGSAQQARCEILSPAPESLALRERTSSLVDQSPSIRLRRATTMGRANQPGINDRAREDWWNGKSDCEDYRSIARPSLANSTLPAYPASEMRAATSTASRNWG